MTDKADRIKAELRTMTKSVYMVDGVPVSSELLSDGVDLDLSSLMATTLGRWREPWTFPDSIWWPAFDPFPRFTRVQRALLEGWRRLSAASRVLRYGFDFDPKEDR